MYYDIVIIGGGAAGMCTAINAKTNSNSILIIEHNSRLGKKILSTGNGKCNLTNRFCKPSLFAQNPEGIYPYHPYENKAFAETVLNAFDADDAIAWFQKLGILCEDKDGYVYPLSEQASAVLDVLRYAVLSEGIEVVTDYQPVAIRKKDDLFCIDEEYECRNLVLACGGMAAPKAGSDGSGYELAKSFGHSIKKPLPALCGLHCDGSFFKTLQGVRADARIRIYEASPKQPAITCRGNVQFNSYGVSGIPVMQISSVTGRLLDQGKKLKVNVEFLPDMDFEKLVFFLADKLKNLSEEQKDLLPVEWLLTGLLNKKVIQVVFKEAELHAEWPVRKALKHFRNSWQYQAGISCGRKLDHPDEEQIFAARIAGVVKHFSTSITGLCGFPEAQVTSGGVKAKEIDPLTMQSVLVPGLFFAGEIVDVDGICGGYNLQWAWATGHAAAGALRKNAKEDSR